VFGLLKRKEPEPLTVTVEPWGWQIAAESGQTILQAATAQGLPWPFRCRVGSCTTCRCRLLAGKVRQLTDASYVLSPQQLADGYILACQSQPQGAVRVHLDKVRGTLPAHDKGNAPPAG